MISCISSLPLPPVGVLPSIELHLHLIELLHTLIVEKVQCAWLLAYRI